MRSLTGRRLSVGLFFEVSRESEVTGSDRHSAQNTEIYALRSKRDFPFFPKSMFDGMVFDKNATSVLTNSMRELDFTDKVKMVQCPTLVLCGEKDSANKKSAYYLAENIPHAELKVIKNTGHIVNEENPKGLAEILDSWR